VVRIAERLLIGTTDRMGFLRRGVYGRLSTNQALWDAGFESIQVENALTSAVAGSGQFNHHNEPRCEVCPPASHLIEGLQSRGTGGWS
jgi:hypothetical protein